LNGEALTEGKRTLKYLPEDKRRLPEGKRQISTPSMRIKGQNCDGGVVGYDTLLRSCHDVQAIPHRPPTTVNSERNI
jgi:hypothetical protein